MSDGNRGTRPEAIVAAAFCVAALFGALVLLYILGNLNGHEAERRQQTPAAYSESAKTTAQRACVGREPAAAFECVYEHVEASQDQAYTKQDLGAQQRAATSALASAVLALLALAVTGVGVWFVKRTLDATLQAVRDTGKATEAMLEANEIAKDANNRANVRDRAAVLREKEAVEERREGERRQLRAYVDFGPVVAVLDQTKAAEPNRAWRGARVTLQNYGQTPADDLELEVRFAYQEKTGPPVPLGGQVQTGLGAIMPKASCTWSNFVDFDEDWWQEIGNHRAEMLVTIVAKYVDAFGEPHVLASTYGTSGWQERLGFVPGTRINT